MAQVKDCPKCGLINPPTAQRCDCGWDFVSRSEERSYIDPREQESGDPATEKGVGGFLKAVGWVSRLFGG